jgi:hypothetical protein
MARPTLISLEPSSILIKLAVAILTFLLVSRGYIYLLRQWKLSAYPLYEGKTVHPIEELHGSRDLITKGFAEFAVSSQKLNIKRQFLF